MVMEVVQWIWHGDTEAGRHEALLVRWRRLVLVDVHIEPVRIDGLLLLVPGVGFLERSLLVDCEWVYIVVVVLAITETVIPIAVHRRVAI